MRAREGGFVPGYCVRLWCKFTGGSMRGGGLLQGWRCLSGFVLAGGVCRMVLPRIDWGHGYLKVRRTKLRVALLREPASLLNRCSS